MCFFVSLGEEMTAESVAVCAENIINAMVFLRFHFFRYLVNWVIFHRLLDVFWVALGYLGLTFSDF